MDTYYLSLAVLFLVMPGEVIYGEENNWLDSDENETQPDNNAVATPNPPPTNLVPPTRPEQKPKEENNVDSDQQKGEDEGNYYYYSSKEPTTIRPPQPPLYPDSGEGGTPVKIPFVPHTGQKVHLGVALKRGNFNGLKPVKKPKQIQASRITLVNGTQNHSVNHHDHEK